MIYWFKNMPPKLTEFDDWVPLLQNDFLKKNHILIAQGLGVIILLLGIKTMFSTAVELFNQILIPIIIFILLLHESLHVLPVIKYGDISLNIKSGFFWVKTNAELSKKHQILYLSLPLIILSVIPLFLALFFSEQLKFLLIFISFINIACSTSDILNLFYVISKPNNSIFCMGNYRLNN